MKRISLLAGLLLGIYSLSGQTLAHDATESLKKLKYCTAVTSHKDPNFLGTSFTVKIQTDYMWFDVLEKEGGPKKSFYTLTGFINYMADEGWDYVDLFLNSQAESGGRAFIFKRSNTPVKSEPK